MSDPDDIISCMEDKSLAPVPTGEAAFSNDFYEIAQENHFKLIGCKIAKDLIEYQQAECIKKAQDFKLWKPFVNHGDSLHVYLASPEIAISPHKGRELLRIARAMEALQITADDLKGVAASKFARQIIPCIDMVKEKTKHGVVYKARNKKDALQLIEQARHSSWSDFEILSLEYRENMMLKRGIEPLKKKIEEGPTFSDETMNEPVGYIISSFATPTHHTVKIKIPNEFLEGEGPYKIVMPSV